MKRLRWYDYLSVNLFWIGLNIRNTAVGTYFMPTLVDHYAPADWKNTALSTMRTAGLIIAMLIQPAAGLVSDRSTSRFGRRRPFILIGVLLDLLFLAAIGLSWNYWTLLVAILLIQFSSNISHGPLQGLIPDGVPEDQRGRASGLKAIFEILGIMLASLAIPPLVAAGHMGWAIVATGIGLLVAALVTIFWVKEQPLKEKITIPFWPPMVKVLGMLVGIMIGAIGGLFGGELLGGIAGLIALPLVGKSMALMIAVALGGTVAMVVAVVIGVWAGSITTLSEGSELIQSAFLGIISGLIIGLITYIIALPYTGKSLAAIVAFNLGGILSLAIMSALGLKKKSLTVLSQEARQNTSFVWWIINRLLFLAAVTSLQGFALYFFEFAFKITTEQSNTLTGSLVTIVGGCTLISALPSGWLADRIGHKLLVTISGIMAAVGCAVLLGTIWVPNLALVYVAGTVIGIATGLFMTVNWAMGTSLVPSGEAGRYLGISNLAGAGAGMIGAGIGGPMADYLNQSTPGLGYFAIFAAYVVLFALSSVSLKFIRTGKSSVIATTGVDQQLAQGKQ